jgi:hypothetical protein
MENLGKNLVSIDKGTNGQTLKKQPISVDHHVVNDKSKIAGWLYDIPG